jgi:hypothetical protein
MVKKGLLNKNIWAGLFFVFLSLYVIYSSFSSMLIWEDVVPEEGFFPLILGVILLVLSLLLLVGALRAKKKNGMGILPRRPSATGDQRTNRAKVISYIAVLLFYSMTFHVLGFLLSTQITLIFVLRWIERESWKTTIAIAFLSGFVAFVLFSHLLGVRLPLGPLEQWRYIWRG